MQFFAKTDQGKMRKMNQDFIFATEDKLGIYWRTEWEGIKRETTLPVIW